MKVEEFKAENILRGGKAKLSTVWLTEVSQYLLHIISFYINFFTFFSLDFRLWYRPSVILSVYKINGHRLLLYVYLFHSIDDHVLLRNKGAV